MITFVLILILIVLFVIAYKVLDLPTSYPNPNTDEIRSQLSEIETLLRFIAGDVAYIVKPMKEAAEFKHFEQESASRPQKDE